MDRLPQTSRRIDVVSVEEITPAVRSSKETSHAARRNKVSDKHLKFCVLLKPVPVRPSFIIELNRKQICSVNANSRSQNALLHRYKASPAMGTVVSNDCSCCWLWSCLCYCSRGLGYLKILEIPKGARHLLIQEFKGTPHILGKCKETLKEQSLILWTHIGGTLGSQLR